MRFTCKDIPGDDGGNVQIWKRSEISNFPQMVEFPETSEKLRSYSTKDLKM